ncbi:MAG: lamin tail domain-containing protein [Bacteroidales bacterium]
MKLHFYKTLLGIIITLSTVPLYAQMYFDFEDRKLPTEFTFSKPNHNWAITPDALSGNYSLQDLIPTGNRDTSTFSFLVKPTALTSIDTFSTILNFVYGTGSTATTSNNLFTIFVGSNLKADSLLLANKKVQSFVIGIRGTSGDDTLRLYYLQNGTLTTIISTQQRVNGKKLSVLLQRSKGNSFTFSVGEGTEFQDMQDYRRENVPYEFGGNNIGVQMFTNATNQKTLAVDNIKANFALKPLQITNATRTAINKIKVEYNKVLNLQNVQNSQKYAWRNTQGKVVQPIYAEAEGKNAVILTFAKDISTDIYTLQMLNFEDEFGNVESAEIQVPIKSYTYGDIVFSELMIKPNTESEFPEEYIELYNRSDEDIDMSNWKIERPSNQGRITAGVIKSKEYALIGKPACEQGSLEVSNRPNLLDAGTTLTLKDDCDVPIAIVSYSDTWYADDVKKSEGGWSLEKLDLNNLQETAALWRASVDERRGTPCAPNSVATTLKDTEPPVCIGFSIDKQYVNLQFNEVLSAEHLIPPNFELEGGYGSATHLYFSQTEPTSIRLAFAHILEQNKAYRILSQNSICDLAGECITSFEQEIGFGGLPKSNDIVINEVLFNPNSGGVDFVELYNRSNNIVELEDIKIANRKTTSSLIDKMYSLPRYTLFPNTYVVLSTNPDIVQSQYSCKNPQAFIRLNTLPTYANEQGCVVLLNTDSTLLEEFYYTDKMHNNILSNKKGVSLERINPNRPVNEQSNWLSAAQLFGFATPTYKNSQHSDSEGDTERVVSISPEVFSPDGDGFDDALFINYNLPQSGYIANVRVFNAAGKLVKTLLQNVTLATEGRFSWDGIGNNGSLVPIGVYVVHIEFFALNGKVKRYKRTCVVAKRF